MATESLVVAASADDAWEIAATVDITDDTEAIDASGEYFGFRFGSIVALAQGDTVSDARFLSYFGSSSWDEPDHSIWAQKTTSTSEFTTTDNDISDRAITTATNSWGDGTALGAATNAKFEWGGSGGALLTGVDLSALIAEVVAQASWDAATIVMIIESNGNDTAHDLGVNFWDHATEGQYQAELEITYTAGAAATRTSRMPLLGVS